MKLLFHINDTLLLILGNTLSVKLDYLMLIAYESRPIKAQKTQNTVIEPPTQYHPQRLVRIPRLS
jgi:hypothetical protein